MNDLALVTAVCADTLNHELAIEACWKMAEHGFGEVVLFTDEAADAYLPGSSFTGFRVERIARLQDRDAYSRFVLHSLPRYIHAAHALIFQWDGFVVNPGKWTPEFLDYDYIGAIWPRPLGQESRGRRVGNGGFSLRSAKLIHAVAAMAPDSTLPEDVVICEELASRLEKDHGVRFAPVEVAKHFSVEYMLLANRRAREPDLVCDATFGFHGFFNFHLAFDDFALLDFIDNRLGSSRERMLRNWNTGALIANLAAAGRMNAAVEVTARCAPLIGMDPARASVGDVIAWHDKQAARPETAAEHPAP